MDPTLVAGVGIISAMLAIVSMAVAVWRSVPAVQGKQIEDLQTEVRTLKKNAVWCEWRVALLINTMQRSGLEIPLEAFQTEEDFWDAREPR